MATFIDMFAGAGGFSEGFLQVEEGGKHFDFLLGSDINATCEVTEIDASTAFQMMKSLRESPEQIRELVKTAYDCIGAEQKRQFDADLQLRRDELAGHLAERLLNAGNTEQ